MAVHADFGVVAQVGKPFCVKKRIATNAQQDAGQNYRQACRLLHVVVIGDLVAYQGA